MAARPGPARPGLILGPDQQVGVEVRVEFLVIGVGVVAGVFVVPPPVAHSDPGTGDPAGHLAGPAPPEHLTVGPVMREQGDLAEGNGQEGGDRQCPPTGAHEREAPPAHAQPGHERDPQRAIAGAASQQAGSSDLSRQSGEVTAGRPRGRGRTAVLLVMMVKLSPKEAGSSDASLGAAETGPQTGMRFLTAGSAWRYCGARTRLLHQPAAAQALYLNRAPCQAGLTLQQHRALGAVCALMAAGDAGPAGRREARPQLHAAGVTCRSRRDGPVRPQCGGSLCTDCAPPGPSASIPSATRTGPLKGR
ncbi:hypothetical protein SCHAM137S_05568 [Streptomyces chartreusis]